MRKFIENLRQKPKRHRQQVAFTGAVLATSFIALVWLSVVTFGNSPSSQSAQAQGPLQSLFGTISEALPY